MKDFLTTTEAARVAGVGVTSIKRWTDQSLIKSIQTPGGHRRVSRAALLEFLENSSNGGSRSNRSVAGDLEGNASSERASNESAHVTNEDARLADRWADIILHSNRFSLQGALLEARGRLGSWYHVADEATLGLTEIGDRWEAGMLTALAEHVASDRLKRTLAVLTIEAPRTVDDSICMLSCPSGETHTLGLSFLQICLHESKWSTLWVGGGVPVDEICTTAASGEVQMVALSASSTSKDAAHLERVVDQVGRACERSGATLVMGGSGAWPETPAYGRRFHHFAPFMAFIEQLK